MEYTELPHRHGNDRDLSRLEHCMQEAESFQAVAGLCRLLSDANRVRIFWLLCHCEECVVNLAALVGMSSPAASHHLRQLKDSGLVVSRRIGKEVYYRAADTEVAGLLHQVITAQEAERKRLSRELHDETAQALTSLIVSMRVLAGKATDEQQRQLLLNARDVASELLLDIRNMAVELRPTALDDLGLAAAMRKYVADFQERFGITVQFSADSDMPMLDSDLSVTLYRIMQESLTNAARHSGASSVEIRLQATQDSIRLEIRDNGKGMPSSELERALREKRLGIFGMQERVELCSGQFSLESSPGSGALISVSIPIANKGA